MQLDLTDEISPADLENARRIAESLRPLLVRHIDDAQPLLVQAGGDHVHLSPERLMSLIRLVEGMVSASSTAGVAADEITTEAAAEILAMAPSSVMRLIERGHLCARLIDGGYRVSRRDVVELKTRQSGVRRDALSELVKLTQENDL